MTTLLRSMDFEWAGVVLLDTFSLSISRSPLWKVSSLIRRVVSVKKKSFKLIDQLVSAVNTLHHHGISHHDLKPDNVLLNRATWQVKIIDFGLSVAFDVDDPVVRHPSGTPLYLPPEVLEDQPHDPKGADIWSLGVTFYFMVLKSYPWGDDLSEEELLRAIRSRPLDLRRFSSKARLLLKGMLQTNPKVRITGAEARNIIREATSSPHKRSRSSGARDTEEQ